MATYTETIELHPIQAIGRLSAERTDAPEAVAARAEDGVLTEDTPTSAMKYSKARGVSIIVTLAGVSFLNTMGSGVLIAALPRIAQDVGIQESLILWPAAVYSLAAGCLLLIFGAIGDIVGTKLLWITGSYLFVLFTVALGFAQTAIQVIMFRTLSGVAISMCLPTAVSIITNSFPRGSWRNTAFAMNGMGQPLGYALGLVLGGIFTDTIGWRWAYYMMSIINFCLSTGAFWSLPSTYQPSPEGKTWVKRITQDIDWVGAVVLSAALGILLYVLGITSSSYRNLRDAENIVLLCVSVAMLVAFPFWMDFQKKRNKPALMPNRLWRSVSFTVICVMVFFCWASLHGIEYFITLYFQRVQQTPAFRSSLQFIPHVIMGVTVNIATALLVARVKVQTLTVVSAVITMIAPILMATVGIDGYYWYAPFWALVLSPVSPDVLFTISNIVISDAFPPELQSLAGGVFNEVSQFGNAVGLAVTAAIAASVTESSGAATRRVALFEGYRAAFWTVFAATATVVLFGVFGLRKGGIVGKKND